MSTTETTTAPPEHEVSRLTDADRARMVRNVGHTCAMWAQALGAARKMALIVQRPDNIEAMRRVAMGAIGCTDADLRRSELEQVAQLVADVAARPELWRFSS